ncbi:MAG: hypothetical protein C3F18_02720 [Nitrosomonadales bacterium]|nr:MAG: hypothetical protein C3F18_02720 [Nitrosomonadales bacterium]
MKFVDLAMGQQFELEGEVYVRTGPLVASHAGSGKQRFMARYMMVRPTGVAPAEGPRKPDLLSSDAVNSAFEIYHGHCLGILGQLRPELPPDRLSSILTQLDLARQAFLDALNEKQS